MEINFVDRTTKIYFLEMSLITNLCKQDVVASRDHLCMTVYNKLSY